MAGSGDHAPIDVGPRHPKASEVLTMTVKLADLRRFDGYERAWKLDKGEYVISAAASSQDIRQQVTLTL